ncbi:low-density lipoprotein receptor-related protein 6-like [Liolophura sinensis]|uniref:low-density lipoprotein receptor-related protein 6-like n=1 Tax=Liolophura sinensis TaxID=3198878 RepID=UPI003158FBEB
MNGEPFLVVAVVLGFVWIAGSSGQDFNDPCPVHMIYCPKSRSCEDILSSACAAPVCKDLKIPCDNESKCYRLSDRCDQIADCKDGVDELFCFSYLTPSRRKCILTGKCDTITTTTTTTRRPYCSMYSCDFGQTCYIEYERCDGLTKCNDKSDEMNCYVDCGSRFRCDDGQGCYSSASQCDDYNDCVDGSDEANCPTRATGLSVGPIVGAVVGIIILTVLVICLKSVMQKAGRRESPGAVAYHTAANYRQANSMFQSSHTYNNNNSSSSQSYPRSASSATSANGHSGNSPYATSNSGQTGATTTYPPQSPARPEHFPHNDPSRLPYTYPVSVDPAGPESPPCAPPPAYETLFPQK